MNWYWNENWWLERGKDKLYQLLLLELLKEFGSRIGQNQRAPWQKTLQNLHRKQGGPVKYNNWEYCRILGKLNFLEISILKPNTVVNLRAPKKHAMLSIVRVKETKESLTFPIIRSYSLSVMISFSAIWNKLLCISTMPRNRLLGYICRLSTDLDFKLELEITMGIT